MSKMFLCTCAIRALQYAGSGEDPYIKQFRCHTLLLTHDFGVTYCNTKYWDFRPNLYPTSDKCRGTSRSMCILLLTSNAVYILSPRLHFLLGVFYQIQMCVSLRSHVCHVWRPSLPIYTTALNISYQFFLPAGHVKLLISQVVKPSISADSEKC
jgi:hypothetical protein